jgi:hypothetical protein
LTTSIEKALLDKYEFRVGERTLKRKLFEGEWIIGR